MKRKKRILLSGACALLGSILLSGCGQKPSAQEAVIAEETTSESVYATEPPEGAKPPGAPPDGAPPGGAGAQEAVDSWDAVTEYTESVKVQDESFTSIGVDENAIHCCSGAVVDMSSIHVDRTSAGSSGGDQASFYGVGAAILETDGKLNIDGAVISTDASGGAGIFAYDKGEVAVKNASIETTQDTSGGVHAAGGGKLYGWDLFVETEGESSAAIRSDRGGGLMVLDRGTFTTKGTGSPAIYCTADIAVCDAKLTALNSEAICLEGKNSLSLYDVDLSGTMQDNEQNDHTWTVIIYQSMSGDAAVGSGTFRMTGGTLTSGNGGLLYTTNTQSTMYMKGVDITYSEDADYFLRVSGNANKRGWGETGANGADCDFTADAQSMKGLILWDSISTLDLYMINHSILQGAVLQDDTYAPKPGDGACNLYISDDSVWTVTEDSTLSHLYLEGKLLDQDGNTVSVVGTDGTPYLRGDSDLKVTVEEFSDYADLSGASEGGSFSDYAVDFPLK